MNYANNIAMVLAIVGLFGLAGAALKDSTDLYPKEKWCWERGGKLVRSGNDWACAKQFIEFPKELNK